MDSAISLPITRSLILLQAFFCGIIVANIYYAQPLIGLIAPEIGLSQGATGIIVSLTQIGYALGLFFLVPLGDLLENRRLIILTVLLSALGLAGAAIVTAPLPFLIMALLIGIGSVAVQMLIPMAAHMASDQTRGRVVGNIMSGLLLGILLARPFSSLVADYLGWRAVFVIATGFMVLTAGLLFVTLPQRLPATRAHYGALLASLLHLFRTMPVLRERAFYQACMFASFSAFWTAVPLELARHYHMSQTQIALFALVGATGAIAAPISGRLADAGYTRIATRAALIGGILIFLPSLLLPMPGIWLLALTGVVLDFCVQMNMVLGQRAVYALDAASRSRLNGLYTTSIFIGGAVGSALAGNLYAAGGWTWVACAGALFPLLALAGFLIIAAD